MMIDTATEVERLKETFARHDGHDELGLMLAMEVALILDRGMAMERRRILGIVARKALNAAELRAEIERPVR